MYPATGNGGRKWPAYDTDGDAGDQGDQEPDLSAEEVSDMTESEVEVSWIEWYCGLKGHDYLIEVEESFIQDDFNLTGLASQVPYFEKALDMILDNDADDADDSDPDHQCMIETSAQLLYGLVHSRFLLTSKGLHMMLHKYHISAFGSCPNSLCNGTAVLPVGLVDLPNHHTAKVFCPRCNEVHYPKKSSSLGKLDGAYFGTTFPHLFFLQYSALVPQPSHYQYYRPKIYGFRVNRNVKDHLRRENAADISETSSSSSESSDSFVGQDARAGGGASSTAAKEAEGEDGDGEIKRQSKKSGSGNGEQQLVEEKESKEEEEQESDAAAEDIEEEDKRDPTGGSASHQRKREKTTQ